MLLLFIIRSDFSAIFVSILGVHLLHRFFFGIMFECSVLWARLWFHSFLFHFCYIFVKDFKILQVTTLFLLALHGRCREGMRRVKFWRRVKCEDVSEAFQDSEAEYFLEFSFDDCFIFVS